MHSLRIIKLLFRYLSYKTVAFRFGSLYSVRACVVFVGPSLYIYTDGSLKAVGMCDMEKWNLCNLIAILVSNVA